MPQSLDLMDALRSAGIPATISGAGPSVLVLTTTTQQRAKATEIGDRFGDFQALPIATSPSGAQVVAG
jgi:homoserine kinase